MPEPAFPPGPSAQAGVNGESAENWYWRGAPSVSGSPGTAPGTATGTAAINVSITAPSGRDAGGLWWCKVKDLGFRV